MPVRKFKAGKPFLAVSLLILFGVLGYGLVRMSRAAPLPPLPNPNGNDDFVKAQKYLVGNPADFERGSAKELRRHIEGNAEALKLVRAGLTRQCRVPIAFSTNYLQLRSLSDIKRLTRLLEAEGWLAELEGRTNDAAAIYLDAIRYAEESCRGGVMMDRLLGIACKEMGVKSLGKLTRALDATTCRVLSRQLQEIERRQEPVADVLRTELAWVRRSFPLRQRLTSMIPIQWLNPTKRVQKDFETTCQQAEIPLRRLIIDLAARAYELDHGHTPKSLNELVPEYLGTVPVDPATGAKLASWP